MDMVVSGAAHSPAGELSPKEAVKSLRDIVLMGLAYIIPQLILLIPQINFGSYTNYVSVALMIAAPFLNRWANGIIIK